MGGKTPEKVAIWEENAILFDGQTNHLVIPSIPPDVAKGELPMTKEEAYALYMSRNASYIERVIDFANKDGEPRYARIFDTETYKNLTDYYRSLDKDQQNWWAQDGLKTILCYDPKSRGYLMEVDVGLFQAPVKMHQCELEFAHKSHWLDFRTKEVRVSLLLYNGNLDLYSKVTVQFDISLGGSVESYLLIDTWRIRPTFYDMSSAWDRTRLTLEIFFLLGVAGFLSLMILQIKRQGLFTYIQTGGWINIVGQILYMANIGLWIQINIDSAKFKVPDMLLLMNAGAAFRTIEEDFAKLDGLNKVYNVTNQLSIFINMIRVINFFQFHERLSIVTKTIAVSLADLLHFAILFFVLLFLFSYMGFKVLGKSYNSSGQLSGAAAGSRKKLETTVNAVGNDIGSSGTGETRAAAAAAAAATAVEAAVIVPRPDPQAMWDDV
eukprot:g2979.t1